MNYGLLLSKMPHVDEARAHYDAMLALHPQEPGWVARFLAWAKQRFALKAGSNLTR